MTNVQKFISKVVSDCQQHGIGFRLSGEDHVMADNIKCSGYFDETDLVVAGGKKDWIDVLVHESCHLDQFLEKFPLWTDADVGISTIDKWIGGTNYSDKKLIKSFQDTILLEHDCEKRSIKKFKKFKLKVDTDQYIKQVNAYILSYWATYRDRKWFPFPYNNPKIVRRMPNYFLKEEEYLKPENDFLRYFRQ
jgi:hypothetical protein